MTDYLNWRSSLSAEQLFAAGESFSYPTPVAGGVLYVSTLKKQSSRQALMLALDGQSTCLTPQPFHLRTEICEYGGKPYWLNGDDVYFANRDDQCLYRQALADRRVRKPQQITSEQPDGRCMYGDLVPLDDQVLAVIVEQQQVGKAAHGDNKCYLASLDLSTLPATPQPIQQGADFYSDLVVDATRQRIAWVEWNHPLMPWDDTCLWLADFTIDKGAVSLHDRREVKLPQAASFCQLMFAANGKLFFSADCSGADSNSWRNFWNIFVYDPDEKTPAARAVTFEQQEFGYPHWQYGDARIAQIDENKLIAFASSNVADTLFLIDQDSLKVSASKTVNGHLQSIAGDAQGSAVMLSQPNDSSARIVRFSIGQDRLINVVSNPAMLAAEDISKPEHIRFKADGDGAAFGYYYPPCNANYSAADNQPPPLLVMVHGGPTARAYGFFDIQKQYWTNRGFAIFDVNHRGSSGYGRQFRDALYNHWGVLDIADIVAGINHLIGCGKANPDQVCIRGKSAGGYTVLNALIHYPSLFKAGACYYGIGNLATLAGITHKFEKYYTDRLIGERYDDEGAQHPSSRFFQRSPINHIEKLSSSMIIFQGLQDKVVPPAVAREIVSALKTSGVEYRYIEYPDEGHGFRQMANNIDALTQELQFYRNVLNNTPESHDEAD